MSLARRKAIFAADAQAAIGDLPVMIRWNGGDPIAASYNGGVLNLEALDGGLIDSKTATIVAMKADFLDPQPGDTDMLEVQLADESWLEVEIKGMGGEAHDPNGVCYSFVIGSPEDN